MLWPETTVRDSDGMLEVGGCRLSELAREYGTPLYVFDETTLRNRARRAVTAFKNAYPDSRVVYAGKAYLSPYIVSVLRDEGLGLDVVSGGELYAGLAAGMPVERMTFHGNNKGEQELREALVAGVAHIAIDNLQEIDLLEGLTAELGIRADVLLRLNPGIDVHTHAKIRTGAVDSKFGFPVWTGMAMEAADRIAGIPSLNLVGYHCHIGSMLFDVEAFRAAITVMLQFASEVRDRHGVVPTVFSPGGGFGIAYTETSEEAAFDPWAKLTSEVITFECARHGLPLPHLIVEPGRSITGPAAVAVYTVGSIKRIPDVRTYVSVDGGMADNIRPTLYDAEYTAELANRPMEGALQKVTIAGRYCESGDVLITDIDLPELHHGDHLVLPAVGAYCLAMASNYNLVGRPAVVVVRDGESRLIRRRETYADLINPDVLPHAFANMP